MTEVDAVKGDLYLFYAVPDLLPAAPEEAATSQMVRKRRALGKHGCFRCTATATHAFVCTTPHGRRWLDSCPPCAHLVRQAFDQIIRETENEQVCGEEGEPDESRT